MKTTFLSISVAFLSFTSAFSADPPKIEIASPPAEGVFVTYGFGVGHNTVIELKGGKFRYWFSSDRIPLEKLEYPLEGTYTAEGDKLVLTHPKGTPLQSNWTARSVDGVVTLWRSDAIKQLEEGDLWNLYHSGKENFFRTGGGSILVPSKKTAEEAWKSPQRAIGGFAASGEESASRDSESLSPERAVRERISVPQFEYLVESVLPQDSVQHVLNKLGLEGWELVSVSRFDQRASTTLYLKRTSRSPQTQPKNE